MSRIGKMPIPVPSGVKIDLKGQDIKVTGSKGSLSRTIHPEITVELKDNEIVVTGGDNDKKINAFRGLMRSLINNMVVGVTEGFKKVLIIEGVGYRASVSGKSLSLSVGYSNPVDFSLPDGVSADVENNTKITLESIDKEVLGMTASQIRAVRKPEPYKGKGIRYEDEHIVRKVGKSGAAAA
ncbi:MAG: 50S ribosomal protein L6 [Desulfobulbaceae bacterium]|nr:MAG: 50S ribosomal protein L6 [Desulfobulbaceae bacterium]